MTQIKHTVDPAKPAVDRYYTSYTPTEWDGSWTVKLWRDIVKFCQSNEIPENATISLGYPFVHIFWSRERI